MRYLLEVEPKENITPSKVKAAFNIECLLIVIDPKTGKKRWYFERTEPDDGDFISGVFKEFLKDYNFFICTKGCSKIVHWVKKNDLQ